MTARRPIVFIGAPGAGKSTIGAAVADALGVGFRDTDADVESTAGISVADIFVTSGEQEFRSLERQAVAVAIREHTGVLALGGGAVLDADTRALLQDHMVVWLRVGLSDASARVGLSGARPLLLGNVRATMLRMLEERTPLYAEVATVTVDTDGREAAEVAADVLAALADLP